MPVAHEGGTAERDVLVVGSLEPADPLGEAASDAFDDLASGRLDDLQQRTAPYRHPRHIRLVMHFAGRDPSCTSRDEVAVCLAIVIGLAFTASWQILAVIVAARYDLGFETEPLAVVPVAVAIALIVVIFDWTIIRSHVQGSTTRWTWLTRGLFTLCMVLLVSEVVASAVFSSDINSQLDDQNRVESTALQQKVDFNGIQQKQEQQLSVGLQDDVAAAAKTVQEVTSQLTNEEKGFTPLPGRPAGKGPVWNAIKLKLDDAEQALLTAQRAADDPGTGVGAHTRALQDLQNQAKDLGKTADIEQYGKLGPAEREALLWTYLLKNPSALYLKRIPLFVVLVCIDLFALLLGVTMARRTRQRHADWAAEQAEWEEAARLVRGSVLMDAQRMIGRLVQEGMTGSAEQRAKRARQRRIYRATEHRVQDRLEHDGFIQQSYAAAGRWPSEQPTRPAEPHTHARGPTIPSPRVQEPKAPETEADELTAPRNGHMNGSAGSRNGAATFTVSDWLGGQELGAEPLGNEPQLTGPRRFEVKLEDDPGRQSDKDLAPFLGVWYPAGGFDVLAERRLEASTSHDPWRATLLTGRDGQGRQHVVKVFSVLEGTADDLEEMSRDAINAQKMIAYSGGLDSPPDMANWLAPGHFGRIPIGNHPDVPYLVMPYYPSGSVKEYVDGYQGQLTLDWCLRLSEQMFRACAQLAAEQIVGCDAKLANFVFDQSPYASALTDEDMVAIGPVLQPDPEGRRHAPVVRMIDLSTVYVRGEGKEDPTRGARGTEFWSSPRAFSGISADQPYELTNLDDAFTVAVNTTYLLTGKNPRYYQFGDRVELERLGGGDLHADGPLITLSHMLAKLADKRTSDSGFGADRFLVQGREWLMGRNQPESRACAEAAEVVRGARETLQAGGGLALHGRFRELDFVPADPAPVSAG